MRRVLFLLLLAAAPVSAAFAAPLTLGLHGGSSIPNLRDKGGNELSRGWSSRVAPFFGLSADVELSPVWSVRTELNWAPQGGKRSATGKIAVLDNTIDSATGGAGGWRYPRQTASGRLPVAASSKRRGL